MFFVSLLLNRLSAGCGAARAPTVCAHLLYIDEIFGYMPPVSEPPSKRPLLSLLKQARAFGLGVVLATQNPVDLDYKGLSNAGTWFLGRLQTERDKNRVLDGLEGATAESGESFDRSTVSEILSNVGKRVFLMHNVHDDGPAVFQTRWALSYLAGPMTRNQIRAVMASKGQGQDTDPTTAETKPSEAAPRRKSNQQRSSTHPALPAGVDEFFLPISGKPNDDLQYAPQILALTKVHFVDSRRGLAADEELNLLLDLADDAIDFNWDDAIAFKLDRRDLLQDPVTPCSFAPLPDLMRKSRSLSTCKKALSDHLYRKRRFELFKSPTLKEYSKPGESERDFRIRLTEQARETRDQLVDKLRKKYATRLQTMEDRVSRAEEAVEREESQASEATCDR